MNLVDVEGDVLLEFIVPGEPQPQGSATAWVPCDKNGDPYRRPPSARNPKGPIMVNVTSDNKDLKKWREAVAGHARELLGHAWRPLEDVGFSLCLTSFLYRAQSHYGTGRNARQVKDHAPAYPLTTPDADKLLRGIFDALTGLVWKDDSQVTDSMTRKRFAVPAGQRPNIRAELLVIRNTVQKACDLPLEERVRELADGGDVPFPQSQAALFSR